MGGNNFQISRLIIGCPFGNYFSRPGITSTLGTFTRKPRGGFFWRAWRLAVGLRYSWLAGGWVNNLGLPNPGIVSLCGVHSLTSPAPNCIVSVHGFDRVEWEQMALILSGDWAPLTTELNLSCPNVEHKHRVEDDVVPAAKILLKNGVRVIAKLPPVRWFDLAEPLYAAGVRGFHLCNTLPVRGGGLSGKTLKQLSLWAVGEFRRRWGDSVTLIGGGGVTCEQDVRDYLNAGADHVAVGSMLLNPFNWWKLDKLLAVASAGE